MIFKILYNRVLNKLHSRLLYKVHGKWLDASYKPFKWGFEHALDAVNDSLKSHGIEACLMSTSDFFRPVIEIRDIASPETDLKIKEKLLRLNNDL